MLCAGLGWQAQGQSTGPPPVPQPAATTPEAAPPTRGQVIIQSHGEPPSGDQPNPDAVGSPAPAQEGVDQNAKADITDAERAALLITSYDLDARVTPARSGLSVRAQIDVRNEGTAPLKLVALQISSTLRWDSATVVDGAERTHLAVAQHRLETDADHTGAEQEALLSLPKPLAPGASLRLDLFYSGTIAENQGRLERLGANAAQRRAVDWDGISASWTGVRGFGNVLWYPVASPQLFLAEGNTLFEAIGRMRLREEHATVRLRLGVEYAGDAPPAAYFCGRRQALTAVADDPDAPVAAAKGIASAEFPPEPLGFRTPNLFVLPRMETLPAAGGDVGAAGSAGESSSANPSEAPAAAAGGPAPAASRTPLPASGDQAGPTFLALESDDNGAAAGFAAAAEHVAPILREWLGPRPLSALTVIDHDGQPFQDGPLLVAPMAVLASSPESPALVDSLTHAWVQTGQPWMDEGLAQFFALLWTEREQGREAAIGRLNELIQPVTLVEPEAGATGSTNPGQPIVGAADELFYRRKAAAVWWMLRDQVGDGSLHAALSAWRTQAPSQQAGAEQALVFEHLLERLAGKDLGWFFKDWVLADAGMPDLSITDVATAAEPASAGHNTGWLVAITVRNEGGAVADVPVIVRSGSLQTTQRMRIPGLSTVTQRVLVSALPTEVVVNDGSVPEVRTATHTRTLNLQTR